MRRIFAVGDINIDILCSAERVAKLGEETHINELNISLGGNAANFSYAAGMLGLPVTLVGMIGSDFATGFLLKSLKKAKIGLNLIRSDECNGYTIALVVPSGERGFYSHKGAMLQLTPKIVWKKISAQLKRNDIVYFGGYFHLLGLHRNFAALLKKIKLRHAIVAFDCCFDEFRKWRIKHLLSHIDLLFLNETELHHVANGSSARGRINWLLSKGVYKVILKQGAHGASCSTKHETASANALQVKVVDTTAAGDVFNAGYIYGMLHHYSAKNCLRVANFVAAHKIQFHGLQIPSARSVENYLDGLNLIEVKQTRSYAALSRIAAEMIAHAIERKPNAVIGIPAGATPLGAYRALARACRERSVDFSKARLFNPDEYAGLSPENKNSFNHYLRKNFLDKINAKKKNILAMNGAAKNPAKECTRFEKKLQSIGIDFLLLGIGRNAHIAFNEPGSAFSSRTRLVELSRATRRANAKYFRREEMPKQALTVGLATIIRAKKIALIASGRKKKNAIQNMLHGKPRESVPASILQRHRNAAVITDFRV